MSKSGPTSRKEADVDELGVDDDLGQQEAESRDQVDEGSCGASVVPGVLDEPPGLGQDGGRVHGAGREVVAELEAVVSQVSNFEHEGDEVEGQEDDPGPHQAHEDVELQVGLLPVLPWQGQVDHEAWDALVDDKCLEKEAKG